VLGRALWAGDRRERAADEMHRALREAERIGLPETLAVGAYYLGELARWDGAFDQARAHIGRAAQLLAEGIAVRGSTDRSDLDEQRLGAALEGTYGERGEHGGEGDRVQE
jgi:hypothetical protein